jgi:outer membrane protein assembly factor BamB
MIYCFDIDGTICTNTAGAYESAQPFPEVIELVNRLFLQNHTIYFYTARGSTTGIDWRKVTEQQLARWGVRYHRLFMGKPTADLYVDDKCIDVHEWLQKENQA